MSRDALREALELLQVRECASWCDLSTNDHTSYCKQAREALSAPLVVGEPTEEMIQAGREEAFNQAHLTYGDMCRAIYRAMSLAKRNADTEL